MNTLTNIVIADPDDLEAIGASARPAKDWQGIEEKGLDTGKIAMLHAILTGETFDEAACAYDAIWAVAEEGPWVVRIADAPIERLARMDEEVVEQVGAELAATEEFETDDWPVERVQMFVAELAELAGAAIAQEKVLFLWMADLSEQR